MGSTITQEDLDATIARYSRNLGFTVEQRFDSHGTTFVFLIAGDVRIELIAGTSDGGGAPTDNVFTSIDSSRLHYFCLAVPDLDAAGQPRSTRTRPPIGTSPNRAPGSPGARSVYWYTSTS